MFLRDKHVKRWHDEEREDCSNRHPANEHETDRVSRGCSRAGHECQRKVAGDSRDAGHHDWPQTNARGLRDGGKFRHAVALQFVGKLDNQNAVFGN